MFKICRVVGIELVTASSLGDDKSQGSTENVDGFVQSESLSDIEID